MHVIQGMVAEFWSELLVGGRFFHNAIHSCIVFGGYRILIFMMPDFCCRF